MHITSRASATDDCKGQRDYQQEEEDLDHRCDILEPSEGFVRQEEYHKDNHKKYRNFQNISVSNQPVKERSFHSLDAGSGRAPSAQY